MQEAFTITADEDGVTRTWTRNNEAGAIGLAQNLRDHHGLSNVRVVYTASGDEVRVPAHNGYKVSLDGSIFDGIFYAESSEDAVRQACAQRGITYSQAIYEAAQWDMDE